MPQSIDAELREGSLRKRNAQSLLQILGNWNYYLDNILANGFIYVVIEFDGGQMERLWEKKESNICSSVWPIFWSEIDH